MYKKIQFLSFVAVLSNTIYTTNIEFFQKIDDIQSSKTSFTDTLYPDNQEASDLHNKMQSYWYRANKFQEMLDDVQEELKKSSTEQERRIALVLERDALITAKLHHIMMARIIKKSIDLSEKKTKKQE